MSVSLDTVSSSADAGSIHNAIEEALTLSEQADKLNENCQGALFTGEDFSDLHLSKELIKACYELGYYMPSTAQSQCIKLILRSQHFALQSPNGTGKTLSFLLPIVDSLDPNLKEPQAVIIAPTLELSHQIAVIAQKFAKKFDFAVHELVRGVNMDRKKIHAQLIIGSLGRVYNAFKSEQIDVDKLQFLVIDEADEIVQNQSHQDFIGVVKSRIVGNPHVRFFFFSATFPQTVLDLLCIFDNNMGVSVLPKESLAPQNVKQFLIKCSNRDEKFRALLFVYSSICCTSSIVFCATKSSADWIKKKLEETGRVSRILHGGLSPEERLNVIEDFRAAKFKVLITTNVLSRGIDIRAVTAVVNYDPPIFHDTKEPDFETYIHRAGRTGRFGRFGVVVNLAVPEQVETFNVFKNYYQYEMQEVDFDDPAAMIGMSDLMVA